MSDAVQVRVLRGSPNEEELAAVIAVVGEAYAAEIAALTVDDTAARPSAWSRSQRGLRQPLRRDAPWGAFAG